MSGRNDGFTKALDMFTTAANALQGDPRQQAEFLTSTATICICAMRGTFGEQFCRDYLNEALRDLDKPATAFTPPETH